MGDSSQPPSDFDLWEQGQPIGILLDSGKETIGNYREQFHLQLSGQDETGTSVAGSQEYIQSYSIPEAVMTSIQNGIRQIKDFSDIGRGYPHCEKRK